MMYPKTVLACSLLSLALAACSTTPPPSVQANRAPALSQTSPPKSQTQRVVALTSLATDMIHKLDKTKLVGIPGNRLLRQNPELATLPQVSAGQTPPNLEKVVALKPDLVIGAQGFHDPILLRLQELGIRTLSTRVDNWQALEDLTRTLAAEMQVDPEPQLQSYRACFTQAKTAKSTLVLVSDQPILAPNRTSWAGDLLQQFQFNNVAAQLQGQSPQRGYVTLSPETILAANPEILILADVGDGTVEKLKSAPFWKQLRAVETDRVYTLNYYGLINPGSIDAIKTACQQLQKIAVRN